jgi:hypothetical protein
MMLRRIDSPWKRNSLGVLDQNNLKVSGIGIGPNSPRDNLDTVRLMLRLMPVFETEIRSGPGVSGTLKSQSRGN